MTAPVPPDFWRRVELICQEVLARYVQSGPLRNASSGPLSIRDGQVVMRYPDELGGGAAVYYGPLYSNNVYVGTGLLVQAPDGTDIASFSYDPTTGWQTFHGHDSKNNIVIGNDRPSGVGLARPYLGGGFAPARFADFTSSTTSTSFETMFEAAIFKQHPRLEVSIRATTDLAGTTGETRVLVDGVQLGATSTEGFGIAYRYFGPAAIDGNHMAAKFVEIQGRVTAGTGALKVAPRYWLGRES